VRVIAADKVFMILFESTQILGYHYVSFLARCRVHHSNIIMNLKYLTQSRDSSACISTGYGMDGRGSIPGRDKFFIFSIASTPALGPTQPPIQLVLGGYFPEDKAAGAWS
jgi:hypothetical protein